MTRYEKPRSLDEALELMSAGDWRVLAGGTDFYPALGSKPLRDDVLDINGLGELRGIAQDENGWRIGARTTWSEIVKADLPAGFDGLKAAAREVGSAQIQNAGTVAGNLCNASPAADGVPALLTLDAGIELRSAAGRRSLPLDDFILGNRRTALRPGELVTAILVASASAAGASSFLKLGARRYLVISIAMAAVRLAVEDERIAEAAVAVGACSAVAQRLGVLERDLVGRGIGDAAGLVEPRHLEALSPIDDVRGDADYRRAAARELVGRAVAAACAHRAAGRVAA